MSGQKIDVGHGERERERAQYLGVLSLSAIESILRGRAISLIGFGLIIIMSIAVIITAIIIRNIIIIIIIKMLVWSNNRQLII